MRTVARRVILQLIRDRRFLALSIMAPVIIIYVMSIVIEAAKVPVVAPAAIAIPAAAFGVHFLTYVLCAIVLVRERTAGTLTRMFVNGYRPAAIIGGYVIAYTGIATVQALVVLAEMSWLFRLGLSWAVMASIYAVIWMLAVISIALGIFVSNFARTEGHVFPFIPMVVLPSLLLSGILVPVRVLPLWARISSRAVPLYYANNVLQQLVKLGGSLEADWRSLAALPVCGAILLLLATRTLRELE